MRIAIARVGEVDPGCSRKFVFTAGGQEVEAFVVNWNGALYAWVNRCRHVPMGLDWVENQFFTEDGCYLQCATHGAWYLPDTGECVAGPPCGKSLAPIPLEIADGTVWAHCPEAVPA